MSPNAEDMLTPEQIAARIAKSSTTMDEFARRAARDHRRPARANPRDDVMTTFCQAEIDGERLDDESIVQEMLLILIGGDETTRHVLSGGMLELIEDPEQRALLRAERRRHRAGGGGDDPVGVAGAEHGPHGDARRRRSAGQQMHEGDQLMLFYPSANRDEDVFDDPHRFDVTPHAEPARRVRVRHALLPRRVPRPPGVPGDVPRAAPASARHPARSGCHASPAAVELRLGPRGHEHRVHPHRRGRIRPWLTTCPRARRRGGETRPRSRRLCSSGLATSGVRTPVSPRCAPRRAAWPTTRSVRARRRAARRPSGPASGRALRDVPHVRPRAPTAA